MSPHVLGSLILAVPAVVVAWAALWRQYRPVFWSVLAMVVVAIGYLNATGATRDVALTLAPGLASQPAPAR